MLQYPKGKYQFGEVITIRILHRSESGTGLLSNSNPLDDFMGEYEFALDSAQMSAWGRKLGISPELLSYWFLAHAVGEILVEKVLPKSGDVAVNTDTIMRKFLDREDDGASLVYGKLLAIELVSPLLFRLVGSDYDHDAIGRVRQMALLKLKDKGVEVGPLTPGQRTKVLGAWGQKLSVALQDTFLPWFQANLGTASGLPMNS